MERQDYKPQIIVDRGIPPDADFVFASTDSEGNRGQLLDFVLKATEHGRLKLSPTDLADGYAIFPHESLPTLVIVVTVGAGSSKQLLRQNLQGALSAIAKDARDRSIWLPLMGTGDGGLQPSGSFAITLDALDASDFLETGMPARIAIAAPADLPDETLNSLQGDVSKLTAAPPGRSRARKERASTTRTRPHDNRPEFIKEIQSTLAELGYKPGAVDGRIGVATVDAIRRFQSDVGIADTGQVDDDLLGALRQRKFDSESSGPPSGREAAPFYPDHPALIDALGREAVAEAIATIVRDSRQRDQDTGRRDIDQTFIVHIHGRWGSGKTSILNFLHGILTSDRRNEKWIIVHYNAWQSQGHGPAWWTLLNRVHADAVEQLGSWASSAGRKLMLSDAAWRIKSGWVPYAVVVFVLVALVTIWSLAGGISTENGFAIVGSIVAIASGVFAFGHTYRVGSARTASTLLELTRDPLRPLTRRYEEVVSQVGKPVAVFIDDLDRCDANFVVELLQSIQTLYRRAPVLYVVAADRDWVCCSYEQIYDSFRGIVSEPGRLLGHLFLEKIFQLSITVPDLSHESRREYWKQLVEGKLALSSQETERIREQERSEIDKFETEGDIRAYTEKIIDDPLRRRIAGAQAFRRMQTAPLRAEREHFLLQYADLVEPNPRAMKRLVNAYGFKRGFELMSGLVTPGDAMVRWTIIELRWPELATQLARNPNDIASEARTRSGANGELLGDGEVQRVAEGLTPQLIRRLVDSAASQAANRPTAA